MPEPDPPPDPSWVLIDAAMADLTVIECPNCQGEGHLADALGIECPRCDGSGRAVVRE